MKIFIISIVLILSSLDIFSQVSGGGTPFSFTSREKLKVNILVAAMPSVDMDSIRREDAIKDLHKDIPYRFGYKHLVDLAPTNSGVWEVMKEKGKMWRLKIVSRNALSINLIFEEYAVPDGATLFIYDEEKTQVLGAFTEKNNHPHGKLATTLIYGDNVVVEYYEPPGVTETLKLRIGSVTHGYRGVKNFMRDLGDSGPCNINAICPQGDSLRKQIRSVALILVNGNSWCSGALINNTCADGKPYFLSAEHCLAGSNVATWVFRFNWDSPTCTPSGAGTTNQTVSGATLRASNISSDFALVEMSSAPPASYNVYYAGWDRAGDSSFSQTAIHHPNGDVKKISFDNQPATKTTYAGKQVWQIGNWETGTTESGSSGSPLFDQNRRVIGQLYGGNASCTNLTDDNYGRLDVSWAAGSAPTTRLKDWLDGCNTGESLINGYDPNVQAINYDVSLNSILGFSAIICDSIAFPSISLKNNGTDTLKKLKIVYTLDGISDSVTWTGSLAFGNFTSYSLPQTALTDGVHNYTVSLSLPNDSADKNTVNNTKTVSFQSYANAGKIVLSLKTDDYGSETSWKIFDGAGAVLYSGGGYPNITGGKLYKDTICLPPDCFTFVINDSYGDGINSPAASAGYYLIQNFAGDTMASIKNVNFGYSETNLFCVQSPIPYKYDAVLVAIQNVDTVICDSTVSVVVKILNSGTDTLKKLTIIYSVDGIADTLLWTGMLAYLSTDTFSFPQLILAKGYHLLTATLKFPNDSSDQNIINNSKTISFKTINNGSIVSYSLKTDSYGNETTWEIKDSAGVVLFSGGPYSNVTGGQLKKFSYCLAPGCYTYIIHDSYGDGLDSTSGYYVFQNANGDTLASIKIYDFDSTETNQFCVGDTSKTGINSRSEQGFRPYPIYPNPSGGTVYIPPLNKQNSGNISVIIYDIVGKKVAEYYNLQQETAVLNLGALEQGCYIVVVSGDNFRYREKLLLLK